VLVDSGGSQFGTSRSGRQLGGTDLRSSPSTETATATPGLAAKSAAAALASSPRGLIPATTAAAGTTPRSVVIGAAVRVGLRAALLYDNVLAVHSMGVRRNSGVVSRLRLELDKRAVLYQG
jgi:hypothetical protein